MKNIRGAFTLPEMMVAVALLAVLVSMVGKSMFDGNRFMNSNANQITMQSAARNVVNILSRDIRLSASAPVNATLSVNGNTVTVNGLTYLYTSPSKLLRNGKVIANGVNRLVISGTGRLYMVTVTTNTSDVLALQKNFTLDAKVRRRN